MHILLGEQNGITIALQGLHLALLMSLMITGASPRVGSSIIRRRGRDISARPIASICCSPPDKVPAFCVRRSSNRGKKSSTSACRSLKLLPPTGQLNQVCLNREIRGGRIHACLLAPARYPVAPVRRSITSPHQPLRTEAGCQRTSLARCRHRLEEGRLSSAVRSDEGYDFPQLDTDIADRCDPPITNLQNSGF